MSTHNICFRREIRKYRYFLVEKSALSRAMLVDPACPKCFKDESNEVGDSATVVETKKTQQL